MNPDTLVKLLEAVASGDTSIEAALRFLRNLNIEDIEYAHIDHHRSLRKGFPEVVFGEGKTAEQIVGILEKMRHHEDVMLATRVSPAKAAIILERIPEAGYDEQARMIICRQKSPALLGRGTIAVLSAGTSDIPVAREALLTAEAMGNRVASAFDVGVAGIHRLFHHRELIETANVLIVVAGMEGALPSVVAGLVSRPVIAVPTSVGYGASMGGLTALFAMLNSCSSNVAVVNIDNGFGAGYLASIINRE
jgi:NCAIR mutase (PurE)-related protein